MAAWLLALGLAAPLPAQELAAPSPAKHATRSEPAASASTSTAVEETTDFDEPAQALGAELKRAEASYRVALEDFKAGRGDEGRSAMKTAFAILVDNLDEGSQPAALRPEFAAMVDKLRNWQATAPGEERSSGLDVPDDVLRATPAASTATARTGTMRDVRVDPDNPITQKFITIFTKQRPKTIEEALVRSGRYRDMMLPILKKKGLPRELFYLVMTESEYKPNCISPSGAAGLWQFMPQTARKYGLEVSYWVDERYDPEKATRAAAAYLRDLYQLFGDWHLALAAYNRGEGGIGRDLQYSRSVDFGGLSDRKILPSETHQYVPKFMACVLIGEHPENYGLHPKYEQPEPYDEVNLPRDLDLGVAAKCAGSTEEVLHRLNPQLRAWCTPKDRPGFVLRIPKGTKDAFETALAKVEDWNPGPTMIHYRVRRGDSLGKIAKLYGTTVSNILETNKISKPRLIRPGMNLMIRPGRPGGHSGHRRKKR